MGKKLLPQDKMFYDLTEGHKLSTELLVPIPDIEPEHFLTEHYWVPPCLYSPEHVEALEKDGSYEYGFWDYAQMCWVPVKDVFHPNELTESWVLGHKAILKRKFKEFKKGLRRRMERRKISAFADFMDSMPDEPFDGPFYNDRSNPFFK